MAKALTATAINAAKPGPNRREISDGGQEGLFLIVQPSGSKSWALRYRSVGKPVKLTLGAWPAMSLAKARAAAAEALEAAKSGDDPAAKKRAEKAARLEVDLSERDKVKTLIGQYDNLRLKGLRSRATVRRELDRFVVAAWGERDIHTIAKRDVIDLLDGIAESGRAVTANRVRAYLNTFMNWCVERDILAMSPATGVKRVVKEASRERVLSDDEIRWLWRACDELDLWGPFTKTLLLTGQRLGEVAGMREAEITSATWHLDAKRTKNGRAHDVPLSEAALDVLASTMKIKGAGYLFTTTGASALSNFHRGREAVAAKMVEIAAKERGEPVEIPHWTFHDLRRTAATGMARLGIPVRVTEAVLNHVSGTGGGIVAVYQRHDYADEKRAALDAWTRYVVSIVEGRAENVIQIRA
ncbi:Prophage integrase IntA [Sulfitobacter sp. DSM 110093]|uniref:tyrosine-type recombinase/integrase n=1 Tax=Sulfitobacter sp. DSM 110093 TaxID=2883127 RepID=UPI001FAD8146|nr:site-specific integrase [Sulfitobacter sp. DSM 110093]UOA32551.1 Prophage integrase IntA [Sulfitobacter sp. DSM 110093]